MKKTVIHVLWFIGRVVLVVGLLFMAFDLGFKYNIDQVNSASNITLPEGRDFATRVLGSPWDMTDYSQISQYINQSGQNINLGNISVQNGIFSAKALNTDAWFFPLFPGYDTAMLLGKIGHNYPIDPTSYSCLYIAAKIDSSPTAQVQVPDTIRAFWFANQTLNAGPFGVASVEVEPSDPHMLSTTPHWEVHKIDLVKNYVGGSSLTKWIGDPKYQGSWQGLRINPTAQTTTFAIDWIRLTDCNPVNLALSNLVSGVPYSFYIVSNTQEILVDQFTPNGSSYSVDMEGIAACSYLYELKNNSTILQQGMVTINQAPIVVISRPSPTSGEDYASSVGYPWDFSSMADITKINDLINTSISTDGLFNFSTLSSGNGINYDAYIELNTPISISSATPYRYLTFRMRTDSAWQNVPQGMIVRWVWHVFNSTKNQDCWLVSQDIPYDVNWQVITIDLWDSFNGLMKQEQGRCNGVPINWKDATDVVKLRFDPNENITGSSLNQALDWIKLTKENIIHAGNAFGFNLTINKPLSEVINNFYYSTDKQNPTKYPMILKSFSSGGNGTPPQGGKKIYLPVINNSIDSNNYSYYWDTTNVPSGTYYICVTTQDKSTLVLVTSSCSEVPLTLIP